MITTKGFHHLLGLKKFFGDSNNIHRFNYHSIL